jgi:hypothetical protein
MHPNVNVAFLECFVGPITTMFWQNEEFTQGLDGNEIYLDGVVCVVDAVFGLEVGGLNTST